MSLVKLNWKPNTKELRQFGAIFMGGLLVLGPAKFFWPFDWLTARERTLGLWLTGMGAVAGSVRLTGPRQATHLFRGSLSLAFAPGAVPNRIKGGLIYFLVFTPMRLLGNLLGRDKLQLRKLRTESYWHDISLPTEIDKYERQF